jgi:hypothetical protein
MKAVVHRDKIQMELIKLDNGEGLLRLTDLSSGLAAGKEKSIRSSPWSGRRSAFSASSRRP